MQAMTRMARKPAFGGQDHPLFVMMDHLRADMRRRTLFPHTGMSPEPLESKSEVQTSKTLIYLRKPKARPSLGASMEIPIEDTLSLGDDAEFSELSVIPTNRSSHSSEPSLEFQQESLSPPREPLPEVFRRESMPEAFPLEESEADHPEGALDTLFVSPQSPEVSRHRTRGGSMLLRPQNSESDLLKTSHKGKTEHGSGRGRLRNRLGQIKRVGVNEYNQRLVKMIKDKYHEELERVDHVDLCDPHVTLLDMREREDYAKSHIHHAINVPASTLMATGEAEQSSKHVSKLLLEVHIDSILQYSLMLEMTHVFIFYYYTKHRMTSFFEFRRIRKLLRRAIRIIEKSLHLQTEEKPANATTFHVCVVERGFDALVGDHGEYAIPSSHYVPTPEVEIPRSSVLGRRKAEKVPSETTGPTTRPPLTISAEAAVHEIIADLLYFGDASLYLKKEMELEPPVELGAREKFFSQDTSPCWLKARILLNASRTPLDGVENRSYFEYLHIGASADPEREFFKALDGIQAQCKPILVHRSPLGCSFLVAYLVTNRRWSVAASLLHVIRCLIPYVPSFDVQTICTLLLFEKSFLSYSPSVKLQSVVLHQLGEEELDFSLAFYESGNSAFMTYREKSSNFFKYVNTNKRSKALKLLESSNDLVYARDGPQDNTALHLLTSGQLSAKDKVSTKLVSYLCGSGGVNLCNIDGMTALHLASNNGAEHIIRSLLDNGASITQVNYRNGKFALHYASRINCSTAILESLIHPCNLNAQDRYGSTALHSASINGNKQTMNLLISKGAQVLANIEGQTPMHLAKQDPKLLQLLMEDARPGEVHHAPFQSFAPHREGLGQFYIDGEEIFAAMTEVMRSAKHSIFITGWWLTPNYYMLREGTPKEIIECRLDKLLKDRAEHGVGIYILIWDSPDSIIPIKSNFTRKYLDNLHANIHIEHHASSMGQFMAWSHHQKSIVVDDAIAFVGGLDICLHRWDKSSHPLTDRCHVQVNFPGRDYYNPRIVSDNDDKNDESFVEYSQLDRSIHPRMPWHDVTCRVEGPAAMDVALNFVQRWNFLLPKRVLPLPARPPVGPFPNPPKASFCQVVRSIGGWSLNSTVETSIYEAYLHCIASAETFIYIENQFFISPPDGKMKISEAILDRIRQAFTHNLPFHVIILLPIHPEGDLIGDAGLQRIYSWQQRTIMHIEEQLRLLTRGTLLSPSDFISFYALRNWDELNGRIVTEMIYVHTKLMITDTYVICGSANINERSMLGDRDSEIAVVFFDRKQASQLRKRLWAEHMGIADPQELNELALEDLPRWKDIAAQNTSTYVKLFEDSIPEAEALTIKQYLAAYSEIQLSGMVSATPLFDSLKSKIQGHLVRFPTRFLHNELQNTLDLKHATFQQIKEIGGLIMDDLFR